MILYLILKITQFSKVACCGLLNGKILAVLISQRTIGVTAMLKRVVEYAVRVQALNCKHVEELL